MWFGERLLYSEVALNVTLNDLKTEKSTSYGKTTDQHRSGGNTYGVLGYLEKPWSVFSLGVTAGYMHATASTSSSENSYYSGSYTDIGIAQLMSNIRLAKNVNLVPSVMYWRILNTSYGSSSIEYQNLLFANVNLIVGI